MASLNVNRATSTLTSESFLKSAVLVVFGSLAATFATKWARNNILDLQMKGGDAVYAIAVAAASLAVLDRDKGVSIALGATSSAVGTGVSEFRLMNKLGVAA